LEWEELYKEVHRPEVRKNITNCVSMYLLLLCRCKRWSLNKTRES